MTKLLNRELIKMEMASHYWAITPGALEGITNFIDNNDKLSFDLFHLETNKPVAYFGEAVSGKRYSYKKGNVGVLVIDGPIIPRATMFSEISGITSIDALTDEFKAFQDDSSITEIVLAMDTPGGVTTGISDFSSLVKSSEKKTTAFVWMAASAGYWIASAANNIVSSVGGMVGSIGVVMGYQDDSGKQEKAGVKKFELMSSQSPNKRRDMNTDAGKAVVQQLLDDLADGFIGTVASNRGKTSQEVIESFGGGAVFAEQRALKAGMIDSISDFETLINSLNTNQTNTMFGFSVEGNKTMSDENTNVLSSDDIAKAERERIKSIESLMGLVEGKHPDIIKAVLGEINRIKFDAGMNKDKAEAFVFKAIAGAQDNLINAIKADSENANVVAASAVAAAPVAAKNSDEMIATEDLINAVKARNEIDPQAENATSELLAAIKGLNGGK